MGSKSASCCIHAGVISIGHAAPPSSPNTIVVMTPMPTIWLSVRARLPSTTASDALKVAQPNITAITMGSEGPQSIPNSTVPATIAKPICTIARATRAVSLPSTIEPREIGVEASRRSKPSLRSMTSWLAPEVSSTSMVNMTMVPGMAWA